MNINPSDLLALFASFQAIEILSKTTLGTKISNVLLAPFEEALKNKIALLTGSDEASKRWEAFVKADEVARKKLTQKIIDHPENKHILDILSLLNKDPTDRQNLIDLGDEYARLLTSPETPDIDKLADLFASILESEKIIVRKADLADAIRDYIIDFRKQLLLQPAYASLLEQFSNYQNIQLERWDTKERYFDQLIEAHRKLKFEGIAGGFDKKPIDLEQVYIHLRTSSETTKSHFNVSNEEENVGFDDHESFEQDEIGIQVQLSLNQVLADKLELVLLGDPGAGKSTLLSYIILHFARKHTDQLGLHEERLPIFARLHDFVEDKQKRPKDYSLLDYFYTYCHEQLSLSLPPNFFENELENGNCCICLDGLDEIGTENTRQDICDIIHSLINRFPRNRWIVTSRIVGYDEAPLDENIFGRFIVMPLSDENILKFLKDWYLSQEIGETIAQIQADRLYKEIVSQPGVRTLATNPLLLTIMMLIDRGEGGLSGRRVDLYEKCIQTLLEIRDRKKGMTLSKEDLQQPGIRLRRRLLEQIAYWMQSRQLTTEEIETKNRKDHVKEGNLRGKVIELLLPKVDIEDYAPIETDRFLEIIPARSGLLIERGCGVYAFAHRTFQEYLAACDIVYRLAQDIDRIWAEIEPHLYDSNWREVLLLLFGLLGKFEEHPDILIGKILDIKDAYENETHRHLFWAARILSEGVEISHKRRNLIEDRLLALLNEDRYVVKQALARIERLPPRPNLIHELERFLDREESPLVRIYLAQSLGQMTNRESYAFFIADLIKSQQDDRVRRYGCLALANLGYTLLALNELLPLALKKTNWAIRSDSIYALRSLGHFSDPKNAIPVLRAFLQDSPPWQTFKRLRKILGFSIEDEKKYFTEILLDLAESEIINLAIHREIAVWLADLGLYTQSEKILIKQIRFLEIPETAKVVALRSLMVLPQLSSETMSFLIMTGTNYKQMEAISISIQVASVLDHFGEHTEASNILHYHLETKKSTKNKIKILASLYRIGEQDFAIDALNKLTLLPHLNDDDRARILIEISRLKPNPDTHTSLIDIAKSNKLSVQKRTDVAYALANLGHKKDAARILIEVIPQLQKLKNPSSLDAYVQDIVSLNCDDSDVLNLFKNIVQNSSYSEFIRAKAFYALYNLLKGPPVSNI
jgi:hypothetical protein